jgi:3-oxoacyl-[acyl-carrier-protein] synthase II
VDLPEEVPGLRMTPGQIRRMDRAARLLLWAAAAAWEQAGWNRGGRVPVVLGTTSGGMSKGQEYYRQAMQRPRCLRGQATRVIQYLVQTQSVGLTTALGLSGPVTLISNACASGSNAIGHAWQSLRLGLADRALTGGYDALSHLVFAGFDSLQALSTSQCRPFDAQRDGLALGEGAAVLALETLDQAQKRGAEILGEIVGYGAASDSYHLTQPHPEGDAAYGTMVEACRVAGVKPEQIGYVNAHGTGTLLNDSAEARAINRWAGGQVGSLPVSSTKASVGHLLGAAGAVEAAVCLLALRGGWLPPTVTLERPDGLCQFPIVRTPTDRQVDYALTNSFGFGGANASLVLKRWV